MIEKKLIQYNVIFMYDIDGINISFPDVKSAITCAFSRNEAIQMGKEVLELVLHGMKCEELPSPSLKEDIYTTEKEEIVEIQIEMGVRDGILFGFDVIELL